jgi:hypothetical protein
VYSRRERRYRCRRCRKTFSATRGTAVYRALKAREAVVQVVALLARGCPPQAIVAACGWDERTVARYQVEAGRVDLGQLQADEIRVRVVGGAAWLALALAVTSRLWLGGVARVQRDRFFSGRRSFRSSWVRCVH